MGIPQHLNFHYFSLFMTKIHTTVLVLYSQQWCNVLLYFKIFLSIICKFVINFIFIISADLSSLVPISCNNVAPVTNLCLSRATMQSHSSQWNKKKLQLKHKNSLFTLQTFHYNYYWWSQSLLNRFGWEIYAFQR